MAQKNLKVWLLYILVISVLLGAVFGIVIVLRATWTWIEVRVILTTVVLALASLCGLACDLARSPKTKPVLPVTGLLLTLITAMLFLFGIWSDSTEEMYWKTTVSSMILTLATVQICLLSIAKLASRFRWVFAIAFQVAYGLAIYLIYMIFAEVENPEAFKFAGVVSIVDAALALLIPILHRISRADTKGETIVTPLGERNILAIDAEIATLRKRIEQLEALRAQIEKS